jgi:superfamily II helicase
MTLREALLLLEVVPNSFIFFSSTNNEFVVHCYHKNSLFSVVKSISTQEPLLSEEICDKCGVELLTNEVHQCTPFVDIAEATIKNWLSQQVTGSFVVEGKWHDVSITISL